MEENKDKKTLQSGKLQLKKTFNAGQIKQSFSHGRSRSVSVEVKKKRTLSGFKQDDGSLNEVPSSNKPEESLENLSKQKNENSQKPEEDNLNQNTISKSDEGKEKKDENTEKKFPKKTVSKQQELKPDSGEKLSDKEKKIKAPKFIKAPKSFENRRQGKLTISQALNDDNEKVRSLAAVKRAREKAKLRSISAGDLRESSEIKERKKKEIIIPDLLR